MPDVLKQVQYKRVKTLIRFHYPEGATRTRCRTTYVSHAEIVERTHNKIELKVDVDDFPNDPPTYGEVLLDERSSTRSVVRLPLLRHYSHYSDKSITFLRLKTVYTAKKFQFFPKMFHKNIIIRHL